MIRIVRYGIGVLMVIGGIVMIVLNPGGFGVDGFAMAVGGGLSVLLINYLFRLGVSGDRERLSEEAARRFLDEHGYWPDEAPPPDPAPDRPRTTASHSSSGARADRRGAPAGTRLGQPPRRR